MNRDKSHATLILHQEWYTISHSSLKSMSGQTKIKIKIKNKQTNKKTNK